jgi:capsular exopolysaccharide synthesis family protein
MNDSSNNTSFNSQDLEGSIDLKAIFGKIMAHLPYFILSIVFALFIAFLVNRYADPKYKVTTTLLIKEKNARTGGMDGAENFLSGMSLLNSSRNIENEQGVLKSKSLVEEALKNLDFGISYYSQGNVRKADLYGKLPFIIELDSNHLQYQGGDIKIKFVDLDHIECWVEKGGKLFVPKTGEMVGGKLLEDKAIYQLNKPIVSNFFAFKLTVINPIILQDADMIYTVKLNNFQSLVNQYFKKYTLAPIQKQASIIELVRIGEYPEKEMAFLNQLCASYIQLGLDEKNLVTQRTIRFIDQQLKSIADTLGGVEEQLQTFRTNNKIVDLSVSGSQIMESVMDLEREKSEQALKNKYYQYLQEYVRNANPLDQLVAPSIMGVNDPVLIEILKKTVELYSKKKTLEMSYQKDNPILKETEQNLLILQNTLLESIEGIQKNSQVILNDLNRRLALADAEISKLPANEQKLLNITRKYQLSDKLYTYLLEKRAEAGIAGAGVNADNRVLDKAMVAEQTAPKIMINYAIAGLLGIILPLLIIFGMDFFNNNIKNHTELQQVTKIPLMGSIVHNTKNTALVIANHPKSQVAEAFRNLRSNLSYLGAKDDKKIIMVTSTVSGEGKTFISMNLSSVLAIGGYKTLLIGVDLRKPKIFQDFKMDNSFGLTNYLIGKATKEAIVQKSGIENLDVITAGPTPPNPSELIMSNAFYKLIEDYKKEYDYIILDTPPIGLVADGLDIMKHSDIVFYVARQNVTQKNYLNLINELYATEKNKSIGLIFNDVNFAAVYGYGYGYGSYGYGYGSGYGYGYGYGSGYGYGGGYGNSYGAYGDVEVEKKSFWKRVMGR